MKGVRVNSVKSYFYSKARLTLSSLNEEGALRFQNKDVRLSKELTTTVAAYVPPLITGPRKENHTRDVTT